MHCSTMAPTGLWEELKQFFPPLQSMGSGTPVSLPRNNLLQTPSFRHDPAPEGEKSHPAATRSRNVVSPPHKRAVITIQLETSFSITTALCSTVFIFHSNILEEEHTFFATLVSVICTKKTLPRVFTAKQTSSSCGKQKLFL